MSEPLYALVARKITEGISAGRFPVGTLLPSEAALCEQFAASRHTVREAIRELIELGLVTRRNGIGTRVESTQQTRGYDHTLASLEDLIQFAATNVRILKKVEDIVADRALAREIGCEPGSNWLHIATVRADKNPRNPPICWTDSYVLPQYSGLRTLLKGDSTALISDLIEKRYGRRSAEVQQSITATGVPAAMANELGVKPGSSALKIVRRYVDRAGEAFSTTVSIHPEGRFKFSMVLRRSART